MKINQGKTELENSYFSIYESRCDTSPTHSQSSMSRGMYVTNVSKTFSLKYLFGT